MRADDVREILLQHDILMLILKQLKPRDVLAAAATCKEICCVASDAVLWEGFLEDAVRACTASMCAAVTASQKRDLVRETWCSVEAHVRLGSTSRARYWVAMPKLAELGAAAASRTLPAECAGEPPGRSRRCLLALDGRLYDCAAFAESHPGGAENMHSFHGRDAGELFDVFSHSKHAHELMRSRLLAFDAAACCGVRSMSEILTPDARAARATRAAHPRRETGWQAGRKWPPLSHEFGLSYLITMALCGYVYAARGDELWSMLQPAV